MLRYLCCLALFAPIAALAQFDEPFTNLKVLPQDISSQDMRATMRSWSMALGLRCTDCHYSPTGRFPDIDFASDEKEKKDMARKMYRMLSKINEDFFKPHDKEISCYTCHHGTTDPRELGDILMEHHQEGGVAAVESSYREIREKYYGKGAYDFSAWSALASVANRLLEQEDQWQDVAALHQLNLEFHPEYDYSHFIRMTYYVESEPNQEKAVHHLTQAMKGNAFWTPNRVGKLAGRYSKEGKTERAKHVLQLLLQVAPDNADSHVQWATYLLKSGDQAGAKAAYEKALELNPKHRRAKAALEEMK